MCVYACFCECASGVCVLGGATSGCTGAPGLVLRAAAHTSPPPPSRPPDLLIEEEDFDGLRSSITTYDNFDQARGLWEGAGLWWLQGAGAQGAGGRRLRWRGARRLPTH